MSTNCNFLDIKYHDIITRDDNAYPEGKSCSEGAVTAWLLSLRWLAVEPADQLLSTQFSSL